MPEPSPLPAVRVQHPHVEIRPEVLGGSPVVRGTRVPVRRLWAWFKRGVTVETLLRRYPKVLPAAVLDALSFAYDNADLVAADLARERSIRSRASSTAALSPAESILDHPDEQGASGAMAQTRLKF